MYERARSVYECHSSALEVALKNSAPRSTAVTYVGIHYTPTIKVGMYIILQVSSCKIKNIFPARYLQTSLLRPPVSHTVHEKDPVGNIYVVA